MSANVSMGGDWKMEGTGKQKSCPRGLSGLVSSVGRALASKLRGPGFKSRPGTAVGPVTIIMWGARPGWKLALS